MTNPAEYLAEGEIWELLRDVVGGAMPVVFFTGAVATLVLMAIYQNSRSLILTSITAMLSGGVIVEFLPAEVRIAGFLLIFAGVSAAGASIYLGREPRRR